MIFFLFSFGVYFSNKSFAYMKIRKSCKMSTSVIRMQKQEENLHKKMCLFSFHCEKTSWISFLISFYFPRSESETRLTVNNVCPDNAIKDEQTKNVQKYIGNFFTCQCKVVCLHEHVFYDNCALNVCYTSIVINNNKRQIT